MVVAAAFVAIAFVLFVGWRRAAPVPVMVGDGPPDFRAESIEFRSQSGALVHGWFVPAPGARAVVILLPGVRANRLSMVERARFLRDAGYAILMIDFQGTGETKGDRITFGWLESRDVLAAAAFARQRAPGVPMVALGSSLGGAAALLATPPLHVDALILEAVYPTIEKATANRLRMRFGSIGPLGVPLLLLQLRGRLGVSHDDLRPIEHIASVGCPVFVIGGAEDRHTTAEDTRSLFARAREPKELWLVSGAAHVDLHRARKEEYERRVLGFLERVTSSPAAATRTGP